MVLGLSTLRGSLDFLVQEEGCQSGDLLKPSSLAVANYSMSMRHVEILLDGYDALLAGNFAKVVCLEDLLLWNLAWIVTARCGFHCYPWLFTSWKPFTSIINH